MKRERFGIGPVLELAEEFYEEMKIFSRRERPIFATREEGLAWLVGDICPRKEKRHEALLRKSPSSGSLGLELRS